MPLSAPLGCAERTRATIATPLAPRWAATTAGQGTKEAAPSDAVNAIQEKRDRLDETFLFERSIDIDTYRHAEKLREELTLVRIDRHSG
jgi:hypothetical protein